MAILHKLIIPPDRDGYTFLDGLEVLSVNLDGGASRFRKDISDSNFKLQVQWTLTETTYNYIRVFYKTFTDSGSLPFLIDLYVDDPFALTEHEVHFVPGTFGLRNQRGQAFIVGATLEVTPAEANQENIDAASLYALFGEDWAEYEDMFDVLINTEIPADYP